MVGLAADEYRTWSAALTPSAELVRRADGGPVRLRQNGRRKKAGGIYYSPKNGDHRPWESHAELKACWWAEVSPDVIAYQTQPHRLNLTVKGRRVSYTPDLQLNLAGGGVQVLEVKTAFDEAKDPDYSAKLAQAAAVYCALGCYFAVVDAAQLEQEPAFSTVRLLQRYRSTAVPLGARIAVQNLLDQGPATLKRVLETVSPGPLGIATVAGLLVKRVISLDVRRGLADDAPVHLVGPHSSGAPLFGRETPTC